MATTAMVGVGRRNFVGLTSNGVLAVTEMSSNGSIVELGGIDTGFFHVLGLAGPWSLPGWPGNLHFILVVGVKYDAQTSVSALVVDDTAVPDASGVFPLPIAGGGGEILITASYANGMVYVLDGRQARIHRYVDTNGDAIPDLRDPAFSVDIASADASQMVNPGGYIARFDPAPDAGSVVLLQYLNGTGDPTGMLYDAVVPTPGVGFTVTARTTTLHSASMSGLPRFGNGIEGSTLSHGQDRVGVLGNDGTAVVVDGSADGGVTWNPLSGPFSVVGTLVLNKVSLSTTVASGNIVRVRLATSSSTGAIVSVGQFRRVVFSPSILARVQGGSSLTIDGDNLTGAITGTVYGTLGIPLATLQLISQSKHHLQFSIPPSLGGSTGFLVLSDATGEPFHTIPLIAN